MTTIDREPLQFEVAKQRLQPEAWRADQVFWRSGRDAPLREVDELARLRLDPLLG